LAQLLPRRTTDVSRLTVDAALDSVELADPVERIVVDLDFRRGLEVMDIAP